MADQSSPEVHQTPSTAEKPSGFKKYSKAADKVKKSLGSLAIAGMTLLSSDTIQNPNIHAPNVPEPTPISAPVTSADNLAEQRTIVSEETKKLIKSTEEKFQVDIVTPNELPEVELARIRKSLDQPFIMILPVPELMGKKFPVAEWSGEDVLKLQKILSELPEHFYAPFPPKTVDIPLPEIKIEIDKFYPLFVDWMRYNLNDDRYTLSRKELDDAIEQGSLKVSIDNRPAQFILADVSSANIDLRERLGGTCNCHDMIRTHQIIFLEQNFEEEDFDKSLSVAAHELTHRFIEPDRGDFFAYRIGEVLKITDWQQYSNIVAEKVEAVRDTLSENEIERLLYSGRNWHEFFPVATEFYIQGQEEFMKVYAALIGKSSAEYLYQTVKDNIFFGRRYEK